MTDDTPSDCSQGGWGTDGFGFERFVSEPKTKDMNQGNGPKPEEGSRCVGLGWKFLESLLEVHNPLHAHGDLSCGWRIILGILVSSLGMHVERTALRQSGQINYHISCAQRNPSYLS